MVTLFSYNLVHRSVKSWLEIAAGCRFDILARYLRLMGAKCVIVVISASEMPGDVFFWGIYGPEVAKTGIVMSGRGSVEVMCAPFCVHDMIVERGRGGSKASPIALRVQPTA